MRVFINPGHHPGVDPGACAGGYTEADLVQIIGEKVADYLSFLKMDVRSLQSDNLCGDSPDYPCVVDEANEWEADIFVSIHLNAAENPDAKGTETLIFEHGGAAELLAHCIQYHLIDTLNTVDRGIKARPDLIVLNSTDMPAVLVEVCFLTNPSDRDLLLARLKDAAAAIARGIIDANRHFTKKELTFDSAEPLSYT